MQAITDPSHGYEPSLSIIEAVIFALKCRVPIDAFRSPQRYAVLGWKGSAKNHVHSLEDERRAGISRVVEGGKSVQAPTEGLVGHSQAPELASDDQLDIDIEDYLRATDT